MTSTPPPQDRRPAGEDRKASDTSAWNWLLLVPIVIPLCTFLYNHDGPDLFGFPRFYWLQLAFVLLGVGCTALVYNRTKRKD